MFDLDTNKIWGKCTVTNESIHKFEFFSPQDIKFKLVFKNEQKEFRRINFDNFTFFVDVDNGPYWYYALDKTRMIVCFFLSLENIVIVKNGVGLNGVRDILSTEGTKKQLDKTVK
jgi:hypothetical protein